MRIVQIVPTFLNGDAVGNNCRAIEAILREAGYETDIYAENIDPRLPPKAAHQIADIGKLGDRDVQLYHMATASRMDLTSYGGNIVFQYHNITPPYFFKDIDTVTEEACKQGLDEMKSFKDLPILCWADSEFNKSDLIQAGYTCPIHTVPILVPFEDYEQPEDKKVLEEYDDDYVNFLFVGRVVPNKAFEDVILTFAWYQKHINDNCRLFLVGNTSMISYVNKLRNYIRLLDVRNVIFPGHISFNAILSYYKLADIFLCMSQHEGFCVPLLEAMYFHVPIIARNTTAIPYTLGNSGVLVDDNDPVTAALLADKIINNSKLRESIVRKQDRRLEDFSHEKIKKQILDEVKALQNMN